MLKYKGIIAASLALTTAMPMHAQGNKGYVGDENLRVPECKITAPPKELHLDKFYKKYVDVNGIPIVTLLTRARLMYRGCSPYALCHDLYAEARGVGGDEEARHPCGDHGTL